MNTEKIKALLVKYYRGETSLEEEQLLRTFFLESEDELPEALAADAGLFEDLHAAGLSEPDFDPLAKINYKAEHDSRAGRGAGSQKDGNIINWSMRVAAGLALLLVGFAAGQLMEGEDNASSRQVTPLQHEVQQLKATLMNSGTYRTASAGERLSAVHMSARIPADGEQLDGQITDILVYTLNNDQNVNVRMAAAKALFRFRSDARVRNALVQSLGRQEDPLMQITLIDMLVEIKASGSANEMKKLLVDSETRELVRERLEVGIAQLKT